MSREMKYSGIPWIGEIPEHWEVCFIKQIMRNKSIKGYPDEMVLSLYRDYGVIPKNSRSDNHNVTSEDTSSYKFVEVGDFVINKMKAWQGSMAVSDYQGIISPAYYICRFTSKEINKRYIHYLLRNDSYKTEYMRLSSGLRVGQWDLNVDDFLRIKMICPSLSEQQKIANFLDKKCSEVDEMIALQEQIIEELKAYKQSVITEAVIKGLTPAAPMRDSGIEWIGQIPEHWEVELIGNRIKEHSNPNVGEVERNALQFKAGNIISKSVGGSIYVPNTLEAYNIVDKGIVMLNGLNLTFDFVTQRVALVKERGVITSTYLALQPQNGICSEYLTYLFKSYDTCKAFHSMGRGLRQTLSYNELRKYLVICPPTTEQQAIADYLDEKCADIDSLIQTKQSKIDSLKEYKKSIIYEYVTGKREVEL